ncbi:MAG: VWA domain-containing protein, partial [Armatimonadetes bacterium]|nr:VWA domain-containing protein [Armatimonadota bacterium]
ARVDSFFERLRINLLLILQIIVIVLVVFALARPFLKTQGSLPREVVLVIDASASMQAQEGGRTRFEAARERALKIVRAAPPGTRFMVVAATARAQVASPMSADRQATLDALTRLVALDTRTDLQPALILGLSTIRGHGDAQVFVLTDRDRASLLSGGDLDRVHYVPLGAAARNVAVTAFEPRAAGPGKFEVFASVSSFSKSPESGFLELWQGGRMVDAREVRVAPGREASFVFQADARGGDTLEARLELPDDLAVDNRAWCVLPGASNPRVLLVTRGNPFLERALTLLAGSGLRIFKVAPNNYPGSDGYAVTIWDGVLPPASARGNHLVLNPPAGEGIASLGEERKGPFTVRTEPHPIFRYVDMGLVSVGQARALKLPEFGKVVASSGDVGLIAVMERTSGAPMKAVVVAFDPYRSDFPLSPSFPIFIANALAWLGGNSTPAAAGVRVEDPIPYEILGRLGKIKVVGPSGPPREENVTSLSAAFNQTAREGVYRLEADGAARSVAVNLLDAEESALKPPQSPETPPRAAHGGNTRPFSREIWWELLLAALLVMLLEWYAYHKRV